MTASVNKPRFAKPKSVKLSSLSSKLPALRDRVTGPPATPRRPHPKIAPPPKKK